MLRLSRRRFVALPCVVAWMLYRRYGDSDNFKNLTLKCVHLARLIQPFRFLQYHRKYGNVDDILSDGRGRGAVALYFFHSFALFSRVAVRDT